MHVPLGLVVRIKCNVDCLSVRFFARDRIAVNDGAVRFQQRLDVVVMRVQRDATDHDFRRWQADWSSIW